MAAEHPIKQPGTTAPSTEGTPTQRATLAEARWQSLAALPGLLVWTAPADGRVDRLPSWYVYTGQEQGAPQGQEWLEAIHPEDRPQVEAAWAIVQAAPGPFVSAFRLRRADGVYRPFTLSATPVFDVNGAVREWVGWGTKNLALHLGEQVAAQQAKKLQALQALTDTALTHLSLDALLDELLRRVQEAMGVDNVAILLLDATGQELHLRAVRGVEAAVTEQVRVPLGQGFAGQIAARRTPLMVEDLNTFPVVTTYLSDHLRSLAGVPLLVEDRVLGVVHVGTAQPTHFTEEDVALLQRVADRIALAVDRAQLYAEAERARAEATLRAQQLETIFETLVDGLIVFDGQGNLLQMNLAARTLLGHARQPDYSLAEAAGRPSPYHPRDEQGRLLPIEQWPITRILRGEALRDTGAVDVRLVNREGQEREVSVSGTPVRDQAGQIAGAVAVLHDVTERRKLARRTQEALEAVLAMAEALVTGPAAPGVPQEAPSPREAKTVARQLAELTCQVLGCRRVGISLLDQETDLLLPLAVAGLSPEQETRWWIEQRQQRNPLHASPAPAMVTQLEAGDVLQVDLTQPPYQEVPNPYGITTMLAVPMHLEERLLGLITLDHGGEVHAYTPEEQRLAQAVAKLVALVVERERLLRERAEAEAKEARLRAEQQRLLNLIDLAHDAVLVRSPVSVILSWNQGAARLYGWTEQEALGQSTHTLLATSFPTSQEAVDVSLAAAGQWEGLLTYTRRDGAEVQVESRQVLVREADGKPAAILEINRDVTEREQLLRQRAEAEAQVLALEEVNQRLEAFISIVSHELRTPVTSLKANLQIVLHRIKQAREAAEIPARLAQRLELLERMESQIRRLTRLLDDLIDLARIRTDKLDIEVEPCDLGMLLREAVREEQASYPERTIQVEPPPDQGIPVLADPDRIGQVITNYVTNALKYSLAHQPVQVGVSLEDDQARVWVRDQGHGIPVEEQPRIWELFHRVPGIEVQSGSGVGLGLGLHISKTLIERQGGQVGVESTPGVGSTFWFTLPLAAAAGGEA